MAFQYSPKIATDGLILYLDSANLKSYSGSGVSWLDISRSGLDSTLSNVSFESSDMGIFSFNGSNSYAYGPSIDVGSSGTVNIWFRQNVASNNKGLFSIGSGYPGPGYTLFYIGSRNSLVAYNGLGSGGYSSQIPISSPYSWNMATYAWSAGSISIYLNAASSTSVTSSLSFPTSGSYFVGAYGTLSSSTFFNGWISNVQVYDRKLSLEEIERNYLALKPRF